MLATLALAILLLQSDDPLTPNYADRLLSPIEDRYYPPRLFPARRTSPIRVGVVFDPAFVTDERLAMIKTACGAWTTATRTEKTAGLAFDFVSVRQPGDAEIVFAFGRVPEGSTLTGLTIERGSWASIFLAVEETYGKPIMLAKTLKIATHEIGHALGIWGHSPDATDIMSTALQTDRVSKADVNTLRIAYR